MSEFNRYRNLVGGIYGTEEQPPGSNEPAIPKTASSGALEPRDADGPQTVDAVGGDSAALRGAFIGTVDV